MPLLLTILSVIAVWAFLSVLACGLLLILKALQSVRGTLEKIALGVRAIEHQAAPLERLTEDVSTSLMESAAALHLAGERVEAATRAFAPAAAEGDSD